MNRNEPKQLAVIEAETAAQFQNSFNEVMLSLDENKVEQVIFPESRQHCAYILYRRTIKIIETAADQYELQGLKFQCWQCRLLDRPEDQRKRRGYCRLFNKQVKLDAAACNIFYEALNTGDFEPIEKQALLPDQETAKRKKQAREAQQRWKAKEAQREAKRERQNIEYKEKWLEDHKETTTE